MQFIRPICITKEVILMTTKPFVKWAGGKGQLLDEIRLKYPRNAKKYCEPFVGGGAVLLDVLNNLNPSEVLINDINFDLINAYIQLRDNVEILIVKLSQMQMEYWDADEVLRREIYYARRKEYNKKMQDELRRVLLFIFLNKTCFNGLYRVNRAEQFNVPIGSYKRPPICDEDNLLSVSKALQSVEIKCGDYTECASFIDSDTFVYIDPPYRPLNKTASFTAYAKNLFDDSEQIRLAKFVDRLHKIGAKVVVSNSDPKNEDETDDFFDRLYANHNISRITAKRMINCNGKSRGNVSELLIANFG